MRMRVCRPKRLLGCVHRAFNKWGSGLNGLNLWAWGGGATLPKCGRRDRGGAASPPEPMKSRGAVWTNPYDIGTLRNLRQAFGPFGRDPLRTGHLCCWGGGDSAATGCSRYLASGPTFLSCLSDPSTQTSDADPQCAN